MVDALRRHARLHAADADVLRCRLDRPFPHTGGLDLGLRLLRHQSPGRIAPTTPVASRPIVSSIDSVSGTPPTRASSAA